MRVTDDALAAFWFAFALACALASELGERLVPKTLLDALRDVLARGKVEPTSHSSSGSLKTLWRRARVPHAWFTHFYVVGCGMNARTLTRALKATRDEGRASDEAVVATLALVLFQLHLIRRFWESAFVATYREGASMHAGAYALGLAYYALASASWAGRAFDGAGDDGGELAMSSSQRALAYALAAVGVGFFAVGNYRQNECHAELASARRRTLATRGPKASPYVIPRGGWFEKFSCAHYTAEIVIYLGLALVVVPTDVFLGKWSRESALGVVGAPPRALAPAALCLAVVANLTLAAREHHQWYLEKFGARYPSARRAVLPGL